MHSWMVFTTGATEGPIGIIYEGANEQIARDKYNSLVYGDWPGGNLRFTVLFCDDEPIEESYGTMEQRYGMSEVIK